MAKLPLNRRPPAKKPSQEIRPHFPRPPPVERASSEVNVVFGVVLLPAGRSPEVRLPRTQKISKNAENDSRRFCLFVYLDLQAAGTDIC